MYTIVKVFFIGANTLYYCYMQIEAFTKHKYFIHIILPFHFHFCLHTNNFRNVKTTF